MYGESAISLLKQLPETKAQISKFASIIRENLLSGETEFLPAFLQIKALSQLFAKLEKDALLKDLLLEETEKHGSKSVELENCKLSIKETGVKFNYANCSDVEWEQLDAQAKDIAEKKKARETFLKSITPDMEVYGSDGVQLNPVAKTSTTSVSITLK